MMKSYFHRQFDHHNSRLPYFRDFQYLICDSYEQRFPRVEEALNALKRLSVQPNLYGFIREKNVRALEACLKEAQTKDDLAYNCKCEYRWDEFEELKCDYKVAHDCNWIQDDDLQKLCKRECSWIQNDDLKRLCKGDCTWIQNDDLKRVCKRDCSWIQNDDWKRVCKRDCSWIQNDDLERLCKGKWYLK